MTRFFFDVHDGVDIIDDEGSELPDLEKAKEEAALFAASLLKDDPKRFWGGDEWTVRVRDETGLTLFDLTFSANLAPILSGMAKPTNEGGARDPALPEIDVV